MIKRIISSIGALGILAVSAIPVFAHVVVKPNQVGVGERLNFVVGVPTEEDNPTVGLRLVIPEGLESVRPNVKPGWTITLKKESSGEDTKVTEIVWTGGSIPPDQRDEFVFSAKAPATQITLVWKAYQTYKDGDVVSWDASPASVEEFVKNNPSTEDDNHNAPRPYAETKVINDLQKSGTAEATMNVQGKEVRRVKVALLISTTAIFIAGVSLWMQFSKGRK